MSFFSFSPRILISLFQKPSTLMYPLVPCHFYKNTRGSIEINIESCTFCGLCMKKCPTNAISVDRKEKVWSFDMLSCISCNYCVDTCPKKSLLSLNSYYQPVTERPEIEYFRKALLPSKGELTTVQLLHKMHEFSIATSIVEQAIESAKSDNAEKVVEIDVEVGEFSGVFPSSLEFCFELVCENTIAAGAKLNLHIIKPMAECLECKNQFETDSRFSPCPKCNTNKIKIIKGKELRVKSITVE